MNGTDNTILIINGNLSLSRQDIYTEKNPDQQLKDSYT